MFIVLPLIACMVAVAGALIGWWGLPTIGWTLLVSVVLGIVIDILRAAFSDDF